MHRGVDTGRKSVRDALDDVCRQNRVGIMFFINAVKSSNVIKADQPTGRGIRMEQDKLSWCVSAVSLQRECPLTPRGQMHPSEAQDRIRRLVK